MRISLFRILIILFVLFESNIAFSQFYNGSQMNFGKNKIQYNEFFWTYYQFEDFDCYFTKGGKELAIYTAKYANRTVKEFEKKLDFMLDNRIKFVVFNKKSDYFQSNIGYYPEEEFNTGGVTRVIDNKIILYYTGNHEDLNYQIRAGIAQIYIYHMLYGTTLTSVIKNSTLLQLPDWYVSGLISYLSINMNTTIDAKIRDGVLTGKYEKYNKLSGIDAVYAGHSLWYYIIEKYGNTVLPNILYITRSSKNIESGFLFTLGTSFKMLTNEWLEYYNNLYKDEEKANREILNTNIKLPKKHKKADIYNVITNNDATKTAFVFNIYGQYKIYILNEKTNKLKKVIKRGKKSQEETDLSYPVIAWHPLNDILSFVTEEKGKIYINQYNTKSKKNEKIYAHFIDKIIDMSYSSNGKELVMSASKNGQTNIYIFNINSRSIVQVTDDVYDDLTPRFIDNSTKIIFASNRKEDSLSSNNYNNIKISNNNKDIFIYDIVSKKIINLTETENIDETYPCEINKNKYILLSNKNGIYNRYTASLDSTIAFIDTTIHYKYFSDVKPASNYYFNINEQNHSFNSGYITEKIDGQTSTIRKFPLGEVLPKNELILTETNKKNANNDTENEVSQNKNIIIIKPNQQESIDSMRINIDNYLFENEQSEKEIKNVYKQIPNDTSRSNNKDPKLVALSAINPDTFSLPLQKNYYLTFYVNEIISQLNYSYLNSMYQPFNPAPQPIYTNPKLNALFKISISDMLEDYRITGGIKINTNLKGNEYLLSFENLKKRTDKQFVFHRQVIESMYDEYTILKNFTHDFNYILKYPFNKFAAIKNTFTVRNDKYVFASTDWINLNTPNLMTNRLGYKFEYIFDNTFNPMLNIYNGTRYKFFAEVYKSIKEDGNMKLNKNNLIVLGFDFRKYIKISRELIWANRFAASTSAFGDEKLIYYLGGVDNWITPKFDNTNETDKNQNYVYQTLATNMRGFKQNVRNGTNFAVINSELRFPILKYFFQKPIKSDFFKNLQIAAFGDIGSAWTGLSPYDKENSFYKKEYYAKPLRVIVENQREPIVYGYGFGLRSRLLGYFIRADWAWGVDDGVVSKRIFYLTLSLDF